MASVTSKGSCLGMSARSRNCPKLFSERTWVYLFSLPRLINSYLTMNFVPAFCWQLLVRDFRFLGQDNEKPRDWGLGQWLIYLTRQLCLSSWEGLLQERTKLDLQKGDFAHGGGGEGEGREVQTKELGQLMDRMWHFWNLQGISVTWRVKCEGPAVCRGALYECLAIPRKEGFVIPRKALPTYRHLWSMYRSWDINTQRAQVPSGAGKFGILIYSKVIIGFTFSFSPSSVWADPVSQVLFCQVGQAQLWKRGNFLQICTYLFSSC